MAIVYAVAFALLNVSYATIPLAHWQFDEMATGEPQTWAWDKTIGYNDLELRKSTTLVDSHSADATGVSGQPGDRAFIANLYSATGAPNGYNGHGRLSNPQSRAAWQNFSGITFSGWVKIDSVPASGSHRLLDWVGNERVELWFPWAPGELSFSLAGTTIASAPGFLTSADVGQWVFIAVTYSAGQNTNGVKFYRGTTTSPVTLFAQGGNTVTSGNIENTGAGDLFLGNVSNLNRNFPGKIDDFRVYTSALTGLEDVRRSGLNPRECLVNPNFEVPPLGSGTWNDWGTIASQWGWNNMGVSYDHIYETVTGPAGSSTKAQRVYAGGSGYYFKQDVQLRGGQTYEASIWVRSSDSARIRFYLRRTGQWYEPFALRSVTLTPNWQKLTIRGGSELDVAALFGFEMLTPGTVWVDDASLREVVQAPGNRELVTSGVVPGTLFGIHINQGNFPVWPDMGQKVLRLWNTATRWGDLEWTKGVWQQPPPNAYWGLNHLNGLVNKAFEGTSNPGIIYTLGLPPGWAVTSTVHDRTEYGHVLSILPPDSLTDWTDYITKIAMNEPYPAAPGTRKIRYWEVWNEVDVTGPNGNGDPKSYAGTVPQMVELSRTAHDTLKNLSSANQVLSPNITTGGLIWLENFLENTKGAYGKPDPGAGSGGQYVDIWSIHTYTHSREPERLRPFFAAVKDILSRYPGQASKPIWNTEGAVSLFAGTPPLDENEKPGIVAREYISKWLSGISNYTWYAWDIHHSLALSVDLQQPDLTPAGYAYGETVEWLSGANVVAKTITPSTTGGERWIVEITRGGTYKGWIVWDTGSAVNWTIPATWGVTQKRTLDGSTRSVTGGTSLTIGPNPILLEKP